MKPVINLDEVEFDDVEENGIYTSSRASIAPHIGGVRLQDKLNNPPVLRSSLIPSKTLLTPSHQPDNHQGCLCDDRTPLWGWGRGRLGNRWS